MMTNDGLCERRASFQVRPNDSFKPTPGRFTHHLELYSTADIDDEVRGWLQDAWTAAS